MSRLDGHWLRGCSKYWVTVGARVDVGWKVEVRLSLDARSSRMGYRLGQ
jgi:hypothetical protein